MIFNLFIEAEEYGFLEPAVEAAEVDVEQHRDAADLAGFAEVEKVVFEVLVAFHVPSSPHPTLSPPGRGNLCSLSPQTEEGICVNNIAT